MVNVLGISLDRTIVPAGADWASDSIYRNVRYGSVLDEYHLVVRHPNTAKDHPVSLSTNVSVYPTGTRWKPTYPWDAYRLSRRIAANHPIDIVYTQDPLVTGLIGYWLKRSFQLPICLSFAGDMIDNPHWVSERPRQRLYNRLGKWVIPRADAYRVVSESEADKLIGMGISPDRVWLVPWLVPFERFAEADGQAIRERYLHENGKERLLLFVGRLVPQKDLSTMLDAMARIVKRHPEALLLMVGEGAERTRLERQVGELGLSGDVVFAGPARYEQIPDFYAACDALLLSSVYEGNARVLNEASASAKPVVATRVSGTPDSVVDGETGYVIDLKDPDQLADRVCRLLDDPAAAERMGRAGRAYVLDRFDERKTLAMFREMLETTVRRYAEDGGRRKSRA